ncbi:MAG: 4a-hydroxytetrahydrobiopterin dehydratase [Deltaproteobacteria bacterium]|nr:4a-hydroxytetrahydrobiopterin dehydratase [Deltaproteobacteria bacterium]
MAQNQDLSSMKCVPCQGGVPPLSKEEQAGYLEGLQGWKIIDHHHLFKGYKFESFPSAVEWVNRVAELAESEGHHPDIHLSYSQVNIELWTHKIDGLTVSDFVFASKMDKLPGTPS